MKIDLEKVESLRYKVDNECSLNISINDGELKISRIEKPTNKNKSDLIGKLIEYPFKEVLAKSEEYDKQRFNFAEKNKDRNNKRLQKAKTYEANGLFVKKSIDNNE